MDENNKDELKPELKNGAKRVKIGLLSKLRAKLQLKKVRAGAIGISSLVVAGVMVASGFALSQDNKTYSVVGFLDEQAVHDYIDAHNLDGSYIDVSTVDSDATNDEISRFYPDKQNPINVNVLIKNITPEARQAIIEDLNELFRVTHAINSDYNYNLQFVDDGNISKKDVKINCINIALSDENSEYTGYTEVKKSVDTPEGTFSIATNVFIKPDLLNDTTALKSVLTHEMLHAVACIGDAYLLEDNDTKTIMDSDEYVADVPCMTQNDIGLLVAKLQKQGEAVDVDDIFAMTDRGLRGDSFINENTINSVIGGRINDNSEYESLDEVIYYEVLTGKDISDNKYLTINVYSFEENGVTINSKYIYENGSIYNESKNIALQNIGGNIYKAEDSIYVKIDDRVYKLGMNWLSESLTYIESYPQQLNNTQLERLSNIEDYSSASRLVSDKENVNLDSVNEVLANNNIQQIDNIVYQDSFYVDCGDGTYLAYEDGKLTIASAGEALRFTATVLDNDIVKCSAFGHYFVVANGSVYTFDYSIRLGLTLTGTYKSITAEAYKTAVANLGIENY